MKLLHSDMRVSFCLRAFRAGIRDMNETHHLAAERQCEQAIRLYRRVNILIRKAIEINHIVMEEYDRLPKDMIPLATTYIDFLEAREKAKYSLKLFCKYFDA